MFQVPATIEKIETMADKSLRLRIDTQELSREEAAQVFELHEKLGWFTFSEQEIKKEDLVDLPEVKKEFKNQKSPSERLRNVLYVVWEEIGKPDKSFESWRSAEMEKIISHYKQKYLS
jgi:hypothetical protein